MPRFDVSCAVEENYVAHSAAMLHSVLEALPPAETEVHYLHGPSFSVGARNRLAGMIERMGARISFIEVADERCAGLPTRGFTRKATWYRIFVPELLPDVDRVLHLDADLIATDSLDPLWELDLSGSYLAAVTNVFERHLFEWPLELGLPETGAYFNAGVTMMNLEQMRDDDCAEAMRRFGVKNAKRLKMRDQDVLNAVLAHRRLPLHPRWNLMNSATLFPWSAEFLGARALDEAIRRPAIRHFEGPYENKPWHYRCERGMRDLYFRHRAQTPWPRARLEGRSPLQRAKRWWKVRGGPRGITRAAARRLRP